MSALLWATGVSLRMFHYTIGAIYLLPWTKGALWYGMVLGVLSQCYYEPGWHLDEGAFERIAANTGSDVALPAVTRSGPLKKNDEFVKKAKE